MKTNKRRWGQPEIKDIKQHVAKAILRMRAGDDQLDQYANQYMLTAEDQDREPDWDKFYQLWDERLFGDEQMATLLSEVMGVEYEEALEWIKGY